MLTNSFSLPPPSSDIDQLLKIMKLCGTPDDEFMNRITSQEARNYIRTLPLMQKKDFRAEFRNANDHAVSLLEKMLELDYEKRYEREGKGERKWCLCLSYVV